MRGKVPLDEWLRMLERVNLKDDRPLESARPGPGRESGADHVVSAADPTRMVSLALAGIDHIPTVKELVDGIVRGAQGDPRPAGPACGPSYRRAGHRDSDRGMPGRVRRISLFPGDFAQLYPQSFGHTLP